MSTNDYLRQTLTHYREQRQRILEQLRPIDLMIRHLEGELGDPSETPLPPDVPLSFTLPEMNGERPQQSNGKRPEIRGDEFFGMSQAEAARAYVNKVGHAVELGELVSVLNKGGCRVGGADPERTLYIALIRNTKDFVRVPNGFIGLRSLYPGLKPGAAGAGKPKDKAKGKAKLTKKKKRALPAKASAKKAKAVEPGPAITVTEQTVRQPLPIKATVREVLANGEFQSGESIVEQVQKKVGVGARSFTIMGVLNNQKDFERDGERFRLRV